MKSTPRYLRWERYLSVLALAAVLAACGGDSAPEPTPTEAPAASTPAPEASTPEPAPTEAPAASTPTPEASTPEPTPAPTEALEPPSAADSSDIDIDEDTTVQEALGAFVPTDLLTSATPVPLGETTSGEVTHAVDVDYFVFEAEEGEFYQIEVGLGTLEDSVVALYDSEGLELASNDDYGDTYASSIYWEAQYSGNHYAAVKGWSTDTGTYTLGIATVEDEHGNVLAKATPVTVGETTPGDLGYAGDVDYFVFEAEEGEFYLIDVALQKLDGSIAVLYDSEGLELASDDDYGGDFASSISIYLQAEYSGNHYVAVEGDWPTDTGSYTLGVAMVDATPVTVGSVVSGEITHARDVDFFVFEAEEGQLYQIDVALGTLEDSIAALYDSEGWELAYNDGYRDTYASGISWEAEYSGSHYVAVEGYATDTGTYTLGIAATEDDHGGMLEEATPVTVGETTPGELTHGADEDFFVFEAQEGRLYQIDVVLGTLYDSVATLYDSEGFELASNDDYDDNGDSLASRISWEAEYSGSHYVAVEGFSSDTGSYTLSIVTL